MVVVVAPAVTLEEEAAAVDEAPEEDDEVDEVVDVNSSLVDDEMVESEVLWVSSEEIDESEVVVEVVDGDVIDVDEDVEEVEAVEMPVPNGTTWRYCRGLRASSKPQALVKAAVRRTSRYVDDPTYSMFGCQAISGRKDSSRGCLCTA